MGYVWFEKDGHRQIGSLKEGGVVPLDSVDMISALGGEATANGAPDAAADVLPPIAVGAKILCVALNFVDHAKEAEQPIPESPILFFKSREAMIVGGQPIQAPKNVTQLDYEGELAIVIGKTAYEVAKEDAWEHIAGVTTFNDVSARNLFRVKAGDKSHLDWFSGKCLNTSTPIGPEVFPVETILEELKAGTTRIRCLVNGEVRQDAPVADMIFDIPTLISFVSSRITLSPGDIIATGTPPGVGAGTGRFLSKGDVVRVEVTGLPAMENVVA